MGFEFSNIIDNKLAGMHSLLEYKIRPLLVNEAKEKAYWKDRSGNARRGINGGVEGGGTEYNLYLAHSEEYGEWLENGTGIYGPTKKLIVPVEKKFLSWVDENGQRFFAKSVRGIKPMHILRDTLNSNKNRIANEIIKYWSE